MTRTIGFPSTSVSVTDESLILPSDDESVGCLQIPTSRGEKNVARLVRNSNEFRRFFGSHLDNDIGPTAAMRILDAGVSLYISPAAHYTTITDRATIEGSKASIAATGSSGSPETLAEAPANVTNIGANNDTVTITVTVGGSPVQIADYTKTASESSMTAVAQAIVDLINGGTGTHGFSATKEATGNFDVVAPVGTGADANVYTLNIAVVGTIAVSGNGTTFSGGVTGTQPSATITAKDVGAGYHGTVTITESISGVSGEVDIVVSMPDSDQDEVLRGIDSTPTAQQLANLNSSLRDVQFSAIVVSIPTGTFTLAGGSQDLGAIVATDYTGSPDNNTGWYAFGEVTNAQRILNIVADNDIDVGLSDYCNARLAAGQPMAFYTTHPANLSSSQLINYRDALSTFSSNTKIDNYLGRIVADYINIPDPANVGGTIDIPAVIDVFPLQLIKDVRFGPWFSAAREASGVITRPYNNLVTNYGSIDNITNANSVYNTGYNFVVNSNGQLQYHGNNSLHDDGTSFLARENVADLVIHMVRELNTLIRPFLFEPNDPFTWKAAYRAGSVFMRNLADQRAIRPRENTDWFWIGDQDVDNFTQVQYNTVQNIENGEYRIRIVFIPIPATEKISIDATLTSSNRLEFVVGTDVSN